MLATSTVVVQGSRLITPLVSAAGSISTLLQNCDLLRIYIYTPCKTDVPVCIFVMGVYVCPPVNFDV